MSASNIPLDQLQQWMQQVLINPLGTADQQPKDFLSKEWKEANVEAFIKPSSRLSGRQRLAIYQRSYLARLRNCMASQFKALAYALGEDLFEQFADLYLQTHPSNHYSLTHLGKQFAAFLENTRPDKDQEEKESWINFMIELIEYEYNITVIFDETSTELVTLATPQTADESTGLVPICYLFEHDYPVSQYYQSFINQQKPELPFPKLSHCLISRCNYQLSILSISQAQYHFLLLVQSCGNVAAAKKEMIQQYQFEEKQMEAAWQTWRVKWIQAELLKEW